jgi:hypothetical protein
MELSLSYRVLMVVTVKSPVFWDGMIYSLIVVYGHLRETCCFHLHGSTVNHVGNSRQSVFIRLHCITSRTWFYVTDLNDWQIGDQGT